MTQLLEETNTLGLFIGLCTFLVIGAFHPLVIKAHYYFGTGSRWWFLVAGIIACGCSLIVESTVWSTILGVVAFSCFWSVREIVEQEERVRKGWFPPNPARKNKSTSE